MANHGIRGLVGAFIAGSLILSSTAAGAATAAVDQQLNPWGVLTAMSGGAPAAAMCGAAATAAAQGPTGCVLPVMDAAPPPPVQAPPPPVPVEAAVPSAGVSPLILGILALALVVGAAIALSGHHGNSPA